MDLRFNTEYEYTMLSPYACVGEHKLGIREVVRIARYMYHERNTPIMTDEEYDLMLKIARDVYSDFPYTCVHTYYNAQKPITSFERKVINELINK